ncbi:hypothetical protein LTS16_015497 [Friedmanniomyces endolithicus]|uniref:Uncharacterized protein n=2 Tax=Friedmanniomyces endolithicus TaxID=329885 RepID=A0AAN6F5J4_9PEZI|nr:hypothetical protein LTR35_001367 [Friedmanniomyces endolithicus]KAK0297853.1 hypothetical protein LTS00_003391 [Friedmanniomyces endolithicus]KAK0305684.1 hypothetical protein LTR82_016692 [Friedmanniomyces endolithicus]KAK0971269.1 hypothetical protein LTS01_015388 [Friedmanniomyces endolithicus]KAK1018419.1 hypothetical protein LTR54_001305 [Friedmanniomyces endolithicus]
MVASVDKLKGKKVVVVGGTSGIGHGAALALLEHGAHVTIVSSSEQRVKSVVEDIGNPNLHGKVGNVREEESFIELLRSLAPIDHLVFSGVDKVRDSRCLTTRTLDNWLRDLIIRGEIAEANFDECKHLFGVKFWGAAICGKAPAKYDIISSGGSLTLTSGTGAMMPGKTASIGGALNAGLFTMTQGLALELADKRIRVNCVVPGIVSTELWDKMGTIGKGDEQAQKLEAMGKKLPVGFCATGEHIAEAYLYAVRADYATGSLITIDGGGVLK